MKIYHVEFENQKYRLENNQKFSVVAKTVSEAERKALKIIKRDYERFRNWKTLKVEWVDTIDF